MNEPGHRPQSPEPPPVPQGRVTQMLLRWLMRSARIAGVETLSPHYRLIDLEGEALASAAWSAGQKIQITMGSNLSARTYTPISWAPGSGKTRLLTFVHGDGPGSRWASSLRQGDTCQFFGPRRSLELSGLESPTVLFGDETSFGLAVALRNSSRLDDVTYLFETSDVVEARPVLEAVGLGQATLIARRAEDVHLASVETEMVHLAASNAHVILTGKASSIQRVGRALKAAGVPSSRMKTKAYWAPGKTGLA
ncbi:siderophore-interacting protein [Bradyrhizobium sp. 14AA]